MLRFGVLGTGYWADVCHAAGLAAHPDAELVGIWGRDPAKAGVLAARHGVAAEAELEALLEKVDAVSVAVPPDVQAELAVRAAEAGRHLLLEKPLALSTAAADRVAETVADAGVASVVFFLLRFRDEVETWLSDVVGQSTWDGGSALFLNSALAPESPFRTLAGATSTAPSGISSRTTLPSSSLRSVRSRTFSPHAARATPFTSSSGTTAAP